MKKLHFLILLIMISITLVGCDQITNISSDNPILNGDKNVILEVGSPYVEQGLSNYSEDVTITGEIDETKLGEYTITYSIDNNDVTLSVTRTVQVVDTTSPVISINGYDMTLLQGTRFTDPGATSIDNYDGNLTDDIIIENTVDMSSPGEYHVVYSSTDSSGNTASVTRNVTVTGSASATGIKNGDFNHGLNGWTKAEFDGGLADVSVENGELVIEIITVGWSEPSPRIDQTGIILEQGKTYEISFDARADTPRKMRSQMGIMLNDDPWWIPYTDVFLFDITTTMKSFSYSFTVNKEDTLNGAIVFELGTLNSEAVVSTVYIDNVVLSGEKSTITFNSNGGSNVSSITQEVGTAITGPGEPTKSGYTFDGWYTDTSLISAFTFTTMPNSDTTLYAKWIEDPVSIRTITFNSNGGSNVSSITQEVGTAITEPVEPTKSGYTFDGWYTDISLTSAFTFTTMPNSDRTLYAKWIEDPVSISTISFNSNGGSNVNSITQEVGTAITEPVEPTKSGYTFDGWYTDTSLTSAFTFTTMPNSDTTLYAKWIEDPVSISTITFNSNGGSNVNSITQEVGTTITEPVEPTKSGYTFDGWYTDTSLTSAFTFTTMPNSDRTLYAKWIEDPVSISTISFNSNGGSYVNSITQEVGTAITEPGEPTKSGYTFDGWYTNISLTSAFTFTTMPNSDTTLYAKWIEDTVSISTITFNSNGGSYVNSITQEVGTAITEPGEPTKSGYTFDGWYIDISLTSAFTFTTMPTSDTTLYAKWIEVVNVSSQVIDVLEQPSYGFTCTNNICVYQPHSWLTYTFNLNNVTFTREVDDNDSSDDQTKSEIVVIDQNWDVEYSLSKNYTYGGTTSMTLSGNAISRNYTVNSFSSSTETKSTVKDDAIDIIDNPSGFAVVQFLQAILNDAGVTLDELK